MNQLKQKIQLPVLIVGAGPTGLVLAIWLRKKGIAVRIIDKTSAAGTTSRALAVQARTLEFYQQLGIADAVIAAGITVQELIMRRSGKIIARAKLGPLGEEMSAFPYLLFYAQDEHEALLVKVLRELGTEVERETELVEFTQSNAGVIAKIKTPQTEETIFADYLCGCDGAHSLVRHILNLNFLGGTYSQIFFVADVKATGSMADGTVQISLSKKDFCIVMPIKGQNSTRLVGIVPPEFENKEQFSYADVTDSVARNTGLQVSRVNWFSTYHVHHRVAQKFRDGRVFLLGDAAHIHSPAGGQGMNTGIGDAINLAWKLADVIKKNSSPKILETYEQERMAFAKILVKTTDTAFRFVASRSYFGSLFRPYLLPIIFSFLTNFRWFLRFAFRTLSQIKINYADSFLSVGNAGSINAGDRLPWLKTLDNFTVLKSLDWQIHIYGVASPEFIAATKSLNLALHCFEWNDEAHAKGLQKDAIYLLRPDGYVGLASTVQDALILRNFLNSKKL